MLKVENISRKFGDVEAVKSLSFQLDEGRILGVIGQNGSGKTTIFRMILDLIAKTTGKVYWKGNLLTNAMQDQVGYLPEERGLYDKAGIEEQLVFFAELKGVPKVEAKKRVHELMERFKVKGKAKDRLKSLSKGNAQKIQLIATIIHEPKLLILDEPFSGLDPVNATLMEEAILDLKSKGSTILFSSHDMSNVEGISDDLLMVHYGEKIFNGTLQNVKESYGRVRLTVEGTPLSQQELEALPGVEWVKKQGVGYLIRLKEDHYGPELYPVITKGEYIPVYSQGYLTLDDIFKSEVASHE